MKKTLIKNARVVNEGNIKKRDILIDGDIILKISKSINVNATDVNIIEADNNYLIPGLIDDQVHFREPGLTHKATIETESKAAVAGGITSFIEMPNTVPQSTTIAKLEEKFLIAKNTSWANYSFMFGGTNDNLNEILKVDPKNVAGLKLFLGSSTGKTPKTISAFESVCRLSNCTYALSGWKMISGNPKATNASFTNG